MFRVGLGESGRAGDSRRVYKLPACYGHAQCSISCSIPILFPGPTIPLISTEKRGSWSWPEAQALWGTRLPLFYKCRVLARTLVVMSRERHGPCDIWECVTRFGWTMCHTNFIFTSSWLRANLQKHGWDLIGMPCSALIFINIDENFLRVSSLQLLWFAKQTMAQVLISIPWNSCFPCIDQTPWREKKNETVRLRKY